MSVILLPRFPGLPSAFRFHCSTMLAAVNCPFRVKPHSAREWRLSSIVRYGSFLRKNHIAIPGIKGVRSLSPCRERPRLARYLRPQNHESRA